MKHYSIGGLTLSLSWDRGRFSPVTDPVFESFSLPAREGGGIDIAVSVESGMADLSGYEEVFTSLPEGLWKVWRKRDGAGYLFSLHETDRDGAPYRFAIAEPELSTITVLNCSVKEKVFNPFEYPLDELLISGYLNINKTGILLHSAMVSVRERGLLFSGTSGSGKSTLSELWLRDGEAEVLTDERVIMREQGGVLWAFGTPWHGTASIHKNKGAKVANIFFLRHGGENSLARLPVLEAANRLMVRCFPTFWHREGMQFALDFCAKVASTVECFEFSFVPDESAVEFIKTAMSDE